MPYVSWLIIFQKDMVDNPTGVSFRILFFAILHQNNIFFLFLTEVWF